MASSTTKPVAISTKPFASSAPLSPNATTRYPISKCPSGADPIAKAHAPIARPRKWLGTLNCTMLWVRMSEAVAIMAINTKAMSASQKKRASANSIMLIPKAKITPMYKRPRFFRETRLVKMRLAKMPPSARAAYRCPSPFRACVKPPFSKFRQGGDEGEPKDFNRCGHDHQHQEDAVAAQFLDVLLQILSNGCVCLRCGGSRGFQGKEPAQRKAMRPHQTQQRHGTTELLHDRSRDQRPN